MGQLYEIKEKIENLITSKGLDPVKTKGEIGLKAGAMLGFITETTPDDVAKITSLKNAVKDVLNETL